LKPLQPCIDAPIAIRKAVDQGWRAYCHSPWTLSGFTLLAGGLNLLAQLAFRQSAEAQFTPAGDPVPAAMAGAAAALLAWGASGLWLLVGLLRGAAAALDGEPVPLRLLIRPDWPAMVRSLGTLALIALVLWGVRELADATGALLTLIQPLLASLPFVARLAVLIYLAADQVLCLPITVLGGATPLAAVQSGRRAIDPHWLQALGLLLVVSLILLAGVLLLLAGLVMALPLALCTLTAAYRQLFVRPGNRLAK
jgi:hypothetical protein